MRKLLVVLGIVIAVALVTTASAFAATSITVDSRGSLSAGGTAVTITGTTVCNSGDTASATVILTQNNGSTDTIAASSASSFVCTGTVQAWSVVAPVLVGDTLKPGKATVGVAEVSDSISTVIASSTVHLQRG